MIQGRSFSHYHINTMFAQTYIKYTNNPSTIRQPNRLMIEIRNVKKRHTTNAMQQLTTNLHNAMGRPHEEGPRPTMYEEGLQQAGLARILPLLVICPLLVIDSWRYSYGPLVPHAGGQDGVTGGWRNNKNKKLYDQGLFPSHHRTNSTDSITALSPFVWFSFGVYLFFPLFFFFC